MSMCRNLVCVCVHANERDVCALRTKRHVEWAQNKRAEKTISKTLQMNCFLSAIANGYLLSSSSSSMLCVLLMLPCVCVYLCVRTTLWPRSIELSLS